MNIISFERSKFMAGEIKMANSSGDFEELQSTFQASLVGLGYKGTVGQLPRSLAENKKLFEFVKMVTEKLNDRHHLSYQEVAKYEELKSAGAVLEGELLQQALSRLSGTSTKGQSSIEAASQEVKELKLRIASAKSQLSTLTAVKSKLSEHHAALTHERDSLESQKNQCKRRLHVAMETANQHNTTLNAAGQELESSIRSVCQFHRDDKGSKSSPPRFLCQQPTEQYYTSESQYLSELTAYSKKQFFEGIASMAAAPTIDDTQCADLDLGDREQVLLRGLTQEQYQAHCQELARLQAVYPVTEMKYLNAKIAEEYAVSATLRAKEELANVKKADREQTEIATLRDQIAVKQTHLSGLKSQIVEISSSVLPGLLSDMAALKVTAVLHGDHDLKLARQEYFTSKQRKVIECLQSQRARHELLCMLYEVELRRHRETHRLLSVTKKQLALWKTNRETRLQGLKSLTLVPSSSPRRTVDTGDLFTQSVCTLMGVTPTQDTPFITIDSLRSSLKQLAERVTTAESVIQARQAEQAQLVEEQESVFAKYSTCEDGERPTLTVIEYQKESDQLKSVVTSMEKNIKTLLKRFDTHKKTLSADASLDAERQLFAYFFTDATRLRSVIGELSKRIDIQSSID